MERGPKHENFEGQEARERFIALQKRFAVEVTGDIKTRQVAEAILIEARDIAVEALVKSGGHPSIMTDLESEFIRPILGRTDPKSMHHDAFRIMIGDVATKVAQTLRGRTTF